MSWYFELLLAVLLMGPALWVQLVLHELSHVLVAKHVEGREKVGMWVWPHWFAVGVVAPVRYWLPWRKAPDRSYFAPDMQEWSTIEFYLGRCWTRGKEDDGIHKPRHIAPMWAGLGAFIFFGHCCLIYWPVFLPLSLAGLLHFLDFWKDYLIEKDRSDGKRWRRG